MKAIVIWEWYPCNLSQKLNYPDLCINLADLGNCLIQSVLLGSNLHMKPPILFFTTTSSYSSSITFDIWNSTGISTRLYIPIMPQVKTCTFCCICLYGNPFVYVSIWNTNNLYSFAGSNNLQTTGVIILMKLDLQLVIAFLPLESLTNTQMTKVLTQHCSEHGILYCGLVLRRNNAETTCSAM